MDKQVKTYISTPSYSAYSSFSCQPEKFKY